MKEKQEHYDFFALGQKYGRSDILEIKRLANSYERDFGRAARNDFEAGVASVFPTDAFLSPVVWSEDVEELRFQGGTLHYSQESIHHIERQRLQIKRNRERNPFPEEYLDSPKTR